MGLRLSQEKTLITHIDEGLDFLGWRIQRHRKRGTSKHYVYTYSARKSVKAVTRKVRTLCRRMDTSQPLDALLASSTRRCGLVRLLPSGGFQRGLRLPQRLRVAAGGPMAASQTPPIRMEGPPPPLLR